MVGVHRPTYSSHKVRIIELGKIKTISTGCVGGIVAAGEDHPIVVEGTRAGDDGVVSTMSDRLPAR